MRRRRATGVNRAPAWALVTLALAVAAAVQAAEAPRSRWDGLWFRDEAGSRSADHNFTLARGPDGGWRYDDGASAYAFRTDGRPWPEGDMPDFSVTATLTATLAGGVLTMVEAGYGRETGRSTLTLSPDGQRLSQAYTRVYPDGRESASTSTAVRVSGGKGFEGAWKTLADDGGRPPAAATPAPPAAGAPAAFPPRRPYWVISTAPDGTMTWFIPATGELIRGRADGRTRPLTGPQQPAGRRFAWRSVAPDRLEFYCYDRGRLVERAEETLSADGATLTDTLWSAGHADERDVNVFVRR